MFTPPSGLNIIWLIKFDNGKLKYLQSKKVRLPPLHQMDPFHPQKPLGKLHVYVEEFLKEGVLQF
jgi:hypothetical protein